MRKKLYLFVLACISLMPLCAQKSYTLWYDKPAQVWTEALPLGNGRLGAMVYGNPAVEQIQLNEETIWAGRPNNNANPDALEYIPRVRDLVFQGKYFEAQTLATEKVCAKTNSGMPYQTFGDLRISFPGHADYKNYKRELSLDSAKADVSYVVDGVTYHREIITSFSDQVVTIRLTADQPGKITCNAFFTSPHKKKIMISTESNCVKMDGVSSWHEMLKGKVKFEGRVSVKTKGGKVTYANGVACVKDADEAVLYVSIATNFNNYKDISGDEVARCKSYLSKAMADDYASSKEKHEAIFRKYMDRVSFSLGEDKYANVTTDNRVQNFRQTNDKHLVETYFQFGRYLLICCSQPGGQPANLQGIWNDDLFPSWDGKYTCNINLEMNYWPAQVTNLPEMEQPLYQLIKDVSETGKETAKVMYGISDGWVLHHNTDIWRVTGAVDKATSGLWPTGGAWLCQHLWQRYLYSGDKAFLRSVYPIMKSAAKFFDETMVKEPEHGWLVLCPSNSPEHEHYSKDGNATTAAGCTMDNQLIFDLWNEIITASKVLNEDANFAQHLQMRLKEMAPMQVGHWGQLQEWMHDWDDPKDTHRHVSHLYGLFPSNQISPFRTPKLFDAARTSLIARGDPSTGWSMAWKICLWSRLLDGDHAYRLLTDQLTLVRNELKKGGTYPNLFDAHPPFQIDGNFGCTAGIVEMLMQSHDGFIYLLPALPSKWKNGEIKGIIARGGFVLDLAWKDGKVSKLVVHSTIGGNCRLRAENQLKSKGLKSAKGENPNPLFQLTTIKKPIVNKQAKLNPVSLKKTYLYDLKTVVGGTYTVIGK